MAHTEFIQTDSRGRTNFGTDLANKMFTVEQNSDGSLILHPASVVSDIERQVASNTAVVHALRETPTEENTVPRRRRGGSE